MPISDTYILSIMQLQVTILLFEIYVKIYIQNALFLQTPIEF